jgi:hypothetical protein
MAAKIDGASANVGVMLRRVRLTRRRGTGSAGCSAGHGRSQ